MEQQKRVVLLVGTDCGAPEREQEFFEWFSQVHDPFMVERGATKATCYRQLRQMPGQPGRDSPSVSPRFLGLYEFESRAHFDDWRENGLPLGNAERSKDWPLGESFLRWAVAYEVAGEVTPESLQEAIAEGRYLPRLSTLMSEDVLLILETYSRYAQTLSDHRYTEWAETFAEDGVMVNPFGTFRGREQLREFVAERFDTAPHTKMLFCNPIVKIDGTTATGETDFVVFRVHPESPTGLAVAHMGRYRDVLRKDGDRWLIAERTAVPEG